MAKRFDLAKRYTEKYKSALLPCRFCGNPDIRIESDRMMFPVPRDGWYVCCSTRACDCTGTYSGVRDAIKRWNEMQGGSSDGAVDVA